MNYFLLTLVTGATALHVHTTEQCMARSQPHIGSRIPDCTCSQSPTCLTFSQARQALGLAHTHVCMHTCMYARWYARNHDPLGLAQARFNYRPFPHSSCANFARRLWAQRLCNRLIADSKGWNHKVDLANIRATNV